MKTFCTLLGTLLMFPWSVSSQSNTDEQAKALIPQGWDPISAAWGDVNYDGRNDLLILLRSQGTMSSPISIMVQIQDAQGNMHVHCNSDGAAEDQHGSGPMYDDKSITFNTTKRQMIFKYTYYLEESEIRDEFSYQWGGGDLRLVHAVQIGKTGNSQYELSYDITGATVAFRWLMDVNSSGPIARFERRANTPSLCKNDNAAFSRELNAVAKSIPGPTPAASSTPPPIDMSIKPESSINNIPAEGLYAYLDFAGDVVDKGPAHRQTVKVGGDFGVHNSSTSGGALMLDGQSYLHVFTTGEKFNAPFSVSAWFTSSGTGQMQTLVSRGRSPDGTGFNFGYNFPDRNSSIYFGLIGTEPLTVVHQFSRQGWHFACATIDEKEMRLYFDGQLVQQLAIPKMELWAFKANMKMSFQPIDIGRELETLGRLFTGTIDNVALYTRAITQAEVEQIYSATRPK